MVAGRGLTGGFPEGDRSKAELEHEALGSFSAACSGRRSYYNCLAQAHVPVVLPKIFGALWRCLGHAQPRHQNQGPKGKWPRHMAPDHAPHFHVFLIGYVTI
jgi:hypothetical protein